VAAGFYARKVLEVGRPMEVAGQQGVLTAITATHVILTTEQGQTTSVANATVLDHVTRQS
jgi:hypothetical protein